MNEELDERRVGPFTIRLFKALADETRLRLVLTLFSKGELCVCELAHALAEIQPKVSRHLSQLRSAGLVSDHRREQWIFYKVRDDLPSWANALISALADEHAGDIALITSRLTEMERRPRDVMTQWAGNVGISVPVLPAKHRSRRSSPT